MGDVLRTAGRHGDPPQSGSILPPKAVGLILDDKADDLDEALWRAFLATHFGRLSANSAVQRESAGRFLCGFTDLPV